MPSLVINVILVRKSWLLLHKTLKDANNLFLSPTIDTFRKIDDLLWIDYAFNSPILSDTSEKAKDVLKTYTSSFWRPRPHSKVKTSDKVKLRYFHIQAAPGGHISPLIKKNPKLFQDLVHKVVQPGDFHNVSLFFYQSNRYRSLVQLGF